MTKIIDQLIPYSPLNVGLMMAATAVSIGKSLFQWNPQRQQIAVRALQETQQVPFQTPRDIIHSVQPVIANTIPSEASPTALVPYKDTTPIAQVVAMPPERKVEELLTETKKNKFVALLPLIAWVFHKSKQKHLENLSLEINATYQKETYRIGLGNQESMCDICFEVEKGIPLRFFNQNSPSISTKPEPLFQPKGPINRILNSLGLNRHERHLECSIVINDPDNYLLRNGPEIQTIVISDKETIRIIHQDPHVSAPANILKQGNVGEWASLTACSLKINDVIGRDWVQQIPLDQEGGFLRIGKAPLMLQSIENFKTTS